MGIQGTLGQVLSGNEPLAGGWGDRSESRPLHAAAASWEACPVRQRNAFRNRQFLATFAFDLVQWFRAEEATLKEAGSPQLGSRRRENHRLALRLRELMAEAELGLDITGGIRAFLQAWRDHQAWAPGATKLCQARGH